MFDAIVTYGCGILGLAAHGANKQQFWLFLVRGVAVLLCFLELLAVALADRSSTNEYGSNPFYMQIVLFLAAVLTALVQFKFARQFFSKFFTFFNWLITFKFINVIKRKLSFSESFLSQTIFQVDSIPHLTAFYVLVTCYAYLFLGTDFTGMDMPVMPIPVPVQVEQLFNYNGLSLIIISLMGVGIFVARKFKDCLNRLGLVSINKTQVIIGISLIFMSFAYDLIWSLYTHNVPGQELALKLSNYNSGTFSVTGGLASSVVLALATALFAGVGEEVLVRGALQPVFGIIPAGFFHGMLHAQFSHAPIFIFQVSLWSIIMGMIKQRTNTTTTIIGHAGFNFLSTFLFAFNP